MTEVSTIERKRIDYIDIAKGIGIIFVILTHCNFSHFRLLSSIGLTFDMPLFFILSGLCFRKKGKEISYSLFKRLVVPFYFTISLFVVFYFALGYNNESKDWIWGGIYGSGLSYFTPFYIKGVGAIWFLLALFWGEAYFKLYSSFA